MDEIEKFKSLPRLKLPDYSFNWSEDTSIFSRKDKRNGCSSDEDYEEEKKPRHLSKKAKKEEERLAEMQIRKKEEELMKLEEQGNPQNASHFERLLLGNPNNSELWIKYMSFQICDGDFDAARGVAERALKTINTAKEQERMNVWIALLNFENMYGTKETLADCLAEACIVNDDFKINSKMLDIFVESKKKEEALELTNKMTKKYKDSLECWMHCAESLFKVKYPLKARILIKRSLTSLNKKEHVALISRFALLENKYGSPQEAQTLFEHVLTTYPARVDVWSCYVDMLVKSKNFDIARSVLQRACIQKLPPKKMKTLFMKRITFEESHGTDETVKLVKKEAQEYVNKYSKIFDNV